MGISSDNNLWRATAMHNISAPKLERDIVVDLVIIGGGFTGCSAALYAAEKGLKVCLLEAKTIGHGGSGRNVGLVNAGLWTPPDEVESILGADEGGKLNEALAKGPELVFSLIKKHEIECEAVENGTLHCANSHKGFKDLEYRYAQQIKRGAPVELLDANQGSSLTGANGIYGALLDHRAGTIQPLSYVQGLAKAGIKAGAFIYENSVVKSAIQENSKWHVTTDTGKVVAERMLVAGNAYIHDNGHVSAPANALPSFIPVYFFQCATKPLPQDIIESILPQKQGCWDTALVMSSFRVDEAGRLIVGSIGSLDSFGKSVHSKWAEKKAKILFPQIGNVDFDYTWHGRIAMTQDHLPRVIGVGDGALSIFGFNGRGISPGTVFGQACVDFLFEGEGETLPLKPIRQFTQSFSKEKALYFELGATLTHLVK